MSVRGFNTGAGVERYDYNALDNVPLTTNTRVKGDAESEYRTGNVNLTKANIGLGNVDNTSDAQKPVSNATREALNSKVDKVTGKGLSTNDYTNAEKQKVDDAASQSDLDDLTRHLNDETNAISANNSIMLSDASPTNYGFELGQIAGGTGVESDSTVRARTTDYIPYKNDEIVLHIGEDYTAAVIYYDANRNYKIGHWWFVGDYVVKGYSRDEILNTGFVRIIIKRIDDGIIDINDVNANVKIGLKGDYKRIYTVALDGSGDFNSLVTAVYVAEDHMDSTVYIKAGVYDMLSDLGSDVINNIDVSHRGLYLKNRIHLIGSGDTLITCLYSGEREMTARWLSIFNAGIYGFTIENLRLSGKNIRYIIHDERDSDEDNYINKYINCRMVFDNTENQYSNAVQCIGGGLGLHGVIVIDGCYFNSINTQDVAFPAVSYHNSADVSSVNGQSLLFVLNSYFENDNTVRINYYGKSTKITQAQICNNSLGRDVLTGAETSDGSSPNVNINVTKFNNVIRQDPTITAILGTLDSGFTSAERCMNLVNVSLMIQGVNIGTSWTDVAYVSLPPTKNQLFTVYDHTNFEALEGYILAGTGHIYMRAKQALTNCSVRAGFSYAIT